MSGIIWGAPLHLSGDLTVLTTANYWTYHAQYWWKNDGTPISNVSYPVVRLHANEPSEFIAEIITLAHVVSYKSGDGKYTFTADSEYVVDGAGTHIVTVNGRDFIKSFDGRAICVVVILPNGWTGPFTMHPGRLIDFANNVAYGNGIGDVYRSSAEVEVRRVAAASPDGYFYAEKPMEINYPSNGSDDYNIMAVSPPGAWARTMVTKGYTHHLFFMSGNEFKVLIVRTGDMGLVGTEEFHSEPMIVKGKRYHVFHKAWPNTDSICIFAANQYHEEMPSDDEIYDGLSRYVREEMPYEFGAVYGLWALRSLLSPADGDDLIDIGTVKEIFKGYTVSEYQNPYLDDPNLQDPDYPTTSYHD